MSREDDTDREDERLGSSDASTGRWMPVIPPELVTSGPRSDTTPEEATPPQQVTSDAADGQTSPQNEPVRRIDKTYDDIGLSTLEGATVRGPRRVQAPAIYVAMIVVTVGFGIVIAANLVALARHPDLTTWLGPEREVLVNTLIVAILVYVACMIALVALLSREPDPRAYSLLVAPSGWIIPFEIIVIGGVGLQDMGAFDVIYFGVGVLCVTWVACLWRVKVDPEPDIPSPPLEGLGTSAGSDGAAAVDAEPAPSVPQTPVVRRLFSEAPGNALRVGVIVVGIGVLAAWRAMQASGLAPADAGEVDTMDFKVGDCYGESLGGDYEQIQVVPCSGPHSEEIYAAVNLPEGDGDFPGFEEIDLQADGLCSVAFERFVGLPYMESVLDFVFLVPSEEGWRAGDREVLCSIRDTTSNEIGSLRGTKR